MATRSWNRVELIGNLTRDVELKYTPQGTAVATFSIATNRTYVSDGEKKEEVDFHRVVAWTKLAELCSQLLKKGNRVFVSGRLQNRSWEGQDGQQRNITEIVLEDMLLLTNKSESGAAGSFEVAEPIEAVTPSRSADEMPTSSAVAAGAPEEEEEKKPAKKEAKPEPEDPGNLDDLPF